MVLEVLKIKWDAATEMVQIDGSLAVGDVIPTSERWKATNEIATYLVEVTAFKKHGDKRLLVLNYDKKKQVDKKLHVPANQVGFGTNTVEWDASKGTGTATWKDNDPLSALNGRSSVVVIPQEAATANSRQVGSVLRKLRPKQQQLRQLLMTLGPICAITGEEEQGVLDTAHIVPVKNGGQEVFSNAILLRADIHRLFDDGLIWFKLSGSGATVQYDASLSARYKKELKGKALSKKVFGRVSQALQLRAKAPDGCGNR